MTENPTPETEVADPQPQVNQTNVDIIKGLLAQAEEGKVSDIFISFVRGDGSVGVTYNSPSQLLPVTLSGAVDWGRLQMMNQATENLRKQQQLVQEKFEK